MSDHGRIEEGGRGEPTVCLSARFESIHGMCLIQWDVSQASERQKVGFSLASSGVSAVLNSGVQFLF